MDTAPTTLLQGPVEQRQDRSGRTRRNHPPRRGRGVPRTQVGQAEGDSAPQQEEVNGGVLLDSSRAGRGRGTRSRGGGGNNRGGRQGQSRGRGEAVNNGSNQAQLPRGGGVPLDSSTPIASSTNPTSRRGHISTVGGRSSRVRGAGIPPPRTFGGQLTSTISEDGSSTAGAALQADALEFRPGQQHAPRPANAASASRTPRPRRLSKSSAPDISTRIHEDIVNGVYECPICTSELGRNSKIWSCNTCWTVFHLSCIKKWSNNQGSTQRDSQQPQDGELPAMRRWRCPGCNLPKEIVPTTYTCWCGKEVDPRHSPGSPPHSCGQTCGRPRVAPRKCPHPCDLQCHAGPCPPCTHMGLEQSCFCGKSSARRRCLDTNYESGWSCRKICGEEMPCGRHKCQRECHEGLCGGCEVLIDGKCYCGKEETQIACSDAEVEKRSESVVVEADGEGSRLVWTGIFTCNGICKKEFDCGKHFCEKKCHPRDPLPAHCPRSPDVVFFCPCGKTRITEIDDRPRQACTDLIPNCNKACLKPLSCGHVCQQVCHSGDCAPCLQNVEITCRCGRTSSKTVCHQGAPEQPYCMRTCKVTLNCGRHECGEKCCSGETKAIVRQSTKKKSRPLGSAPRALDEGFEAEHICTRVCDRTLKCGIHTCPELCHKGPCGSCRDAIFFEVSCNCGRTVLQPPLPCGTKPPACSYNCERPTGCGHPKVPHNCHGDEEACPKCPFLTEKSCMCGKKSLKNQPCWLSDVRCGEPCGIKQRCGSHYCRKLCHRPGDCESATKACQQQCGKPKKACGHPCEEQCHAPYPCEESRPCNSKIIITCDCQTLKTEVKCNASRLGNGNSNKTLKCDDECARLERNRKLALALNIDQENHTDDHIPYSAETLEMFKENPKWAQEQERTFRIFAADAKEKRQRFKPMPGTQRAFLHSLAEDFGLDSESMDPDPHRHVAVFKTPRFVASPMKTLAECMRIKSESSAASSSKVASSSKSTITNNTTFNAILLTAPRFGLTVTELQKAFVPAFESHAFGYTFNITFLPSEEIVLKASSPLASTTLLTLKHAISTIVSSLALSKSAQLCAVDSSMNVLRRESDTTSTSGGEGGWSRVAAKAATPRGWRPDQEEQNTVGSRFVVLGSSSAAKKGKSKAVKKEAEASVAEDWWAEEEKEEERERERVVEKEIVSANASAHGSGEESGAEVEKWYVAPEAEGEGNVEEAMMEVEG